MMDSYPPRVCFFCKEGALDDEDCDVELIVDEFDEAYHEDCLAEVE